MTRNRRINTPTDNCKATNSDARMKITVIGSHVLTLVLGHSCFFLKKLFCIKLASLGQVGVCCDIKQNWGRGDKGFLSVLS